MKTIGSNFLNRRFLPYGLLFGLSQIFFLFFYASVFTTDKNDWIARFQTFFNLATKQHALPGFSVMPPAVPVFKISGVLFSILQSIFHAPLTQAGLLYVISVMLAMGGALMLLFFLLRRLITDKEALFVTLLILINPFYWRSNVSDVYISFFFIFCLLCLFLFIKRREFQWIFFSALFLALAVATRQAGIALLPLTLFALLLARKYRLVTKNDFWRAVLWGAVLSIILFTVIWPQAIFHTQNALGKNVDVTRYIKTTTTENQAFFTIAIHRVAKALGYYPYAWIFLAGNFLLFGVRRLKKQDAALRIMSLTCLSAFLLFLVVLPFYNEGLQSSALRYTLPGVFCLDLLLGIEFYRQLINLITHKKTYAIAYAGVFGLLLILSYYYYAYI